MENDNSKCKIFRYSYFLDIFNFTLSFLILRFSFLTF